MSQTAMKLKKPARIKGRVMYAELVMGVLGTPYKEVSDAIEDLHATPAFLRNSKDRVVEVLVLRLDNRDALVERVAQALLNAECKRNDWPDQRLRDVMGENVYRDDARAALRSIGVPLKKK